MATIDYLSALAIFLKTQIPEAIRNTPEFQRSDAEILQTFLQSTAHLPMHEPEILGSGSGDATDLRAYVQDLIQAVRQRAPASA